MKLQTTSFIESTGVACSDSINHNRVQVLRIPVLLHVRSPGDLRRLAANQAPVKDHQPMLE